MDILTGLNIVKENLDKLNVSGLDSARRLVWCWEIVDKIISAVSVAQESTMDNKEKEEPNG